MREEGCHSIHHQILTVNSHSAKVLMNEQISQPFHFLICVTDIMVGLSGEVSQSADSPAHVWYTLGAQ